MVQKEDQGKVFYWLVLNPTTVNKTDKNHCLCGIAILVGHRRQWSEEIMEMVPVTIQWCDGVRGGLSLQRR